MKKIDFCCILKFTDGFGMDPDPLVRGTAPRTSWQKVSVGGDKASHANNKKNSRIAIRYALRGSKKNCSCEM
jgi:hypothetical protein